MQDKVDQKPMEVSVVTLTKQHLQALSPEEQTLFVLLGHLANELNFIVKLLLMFGNLREDNNLKEQARLVQAMFFIRLFAGKAWEGWALIQRNYFRASISKQFAQIHTPEDIRALRALKKYFSPKNSMNVIRNNRSFHYGSTQLNAAMLECAENNESLLSLHETHANSLYYLAESAVIRSTANDVDPDLEVGLDRLLNEIGEVHGNFLTFSAGCLHLLLAKMEDLTGNRARIERHILSDVGLLSDVRIPFYVYINP